MKKRMKLSMCSKKALAGILAAAMMLSQSSIVAFAEEVKAVSGDEIVVEEATETEVIAEDEAVAEEAVEAEVDFEAEDEAYYQEEEPEEEVGEISEVDPIVTDLNGQEDAQGAALTEAKPNEDDFEVSGKVRMSGSYFRAAVSGPHSVTLSVPKSVKTAKYFKFWRLMKDGTVEPVLEDEDKWTGKLSVVDKNYDPATASGIYFMQTFTKGGSYLPAGYYAALAKISVFQVDLAGKRTAGGVDYYDIDVAFELLQGTAKHPVTYQLYASTTDPYKESKDLGAFDKAKISKSSGTGLTQYRDAGIYSGRPCAAITATMGKAEFDRAKNGCHVWLTPYVDLNADGKRNSTIDLSSAAKKTNGKLKVPGVNIIYIGGHGVEGHDACRSEIYAYVEDAGVDKNTTGLGETYTYTKNKFAPYLGKYAVKKRSYEIRKTNVKTGEETKAALVDVSECGKVTIVKQSDGTWEEQPYEEEDEEKYEDDDETMVVRKVQIKNSEPNIAYTYRANVWVEEAELKGALGAPYTHKFNFVTPANAKICNIGETKVKLTFETEKCAKSYVVLRSKKDFGSIDAAEAYATSFMDNDEYTLKKLTGKRKGDAIGEDPNPYFVKAGGASNNKSDGSEMSIEAKVPGNGRYYAFLLCPQSKELGLGEAAAFGEHGWAPSPEKVKAVSGLANITVTWSSVKKAEAYYIYRTTETDANGDPVFAFDAPATYVVMKTDPEFKKRKLVIPSGTLDPDEKYFFGVKAVVASNLSEDAGVQHASAKVQATPVTGIEIVPVNDKKEGVWTKSAVIRFKAQKDFASVASYHLTVLEDGSPFYEDDISGATYQDGSKTKNVKSGSTLSRKITGMSRSKVYTFVLQTISTPATGSIEGLEQENEFAMPGAIEILNLDEKVLGHNKRNPNSSGDHTVPNSYGTFTDIHGRTYANCLKSGSDGSSSDAAYKASGSGQKFIVVTDTNSEGDYLRLSFDGTKAGITVKYDASRFIKGKGGKKYHFITVTPKPLSKGIVKVALMYTKDIPASGANTRQPISGPWTKLGIYNGDKKIRTTQENFYVKYN